ncbi:MAG TPA: alpha/beta hydrolase [Candidatus Paceibacterota bacterium]|nr:alpha/beta hydrolase [Candidatus Paceibacterota bacterium]
MEPIVLIHGYSAEGKDAAGEIPKIYGTLPQSLKQIYGRKSVVEINLSRYISLDDGITIDDISRALDRALRTDFSKLLQGRFHVIIHSTGALVIRNWLRKFSPKPSPVGNLVYLAGANLGSGWAHIGKGQVAKWGRFVFQDGTERGVQVLNALELGSDWTLDLHLHFLKPGNALALDYGVCESVIIGTQADVKWYPIPIRYAKEDGSDGVVRVSASNVNFNYLRFGPTQSALETDWKEASRQQDKHLDRAGKQTTFYELKESSTPGQNTRPVVPFAIPYSCAHSGDEMGVVSGSLPKAQVLRLLQGALEATPNTWPALVDSFQVETDATYDLALKQQTPSWWKKWLDDPRAQYDHHAQIIFRVRDQDGRPVKSFDIFFSSEQEDTKARPIQTLFEDKHLNGMNPNILTFYLRTDAFVAARRKWVSQLPEVAMCALEISAVESETEEILYLPFRLELKTDQLTQWIQGHRTTIMDIELFRLPSPNVFKMIRA